MTSTQPFISSAEAEAYICVDVETAGPIPGDYSLLSIGACTILEPQLTFYIELKPSHLKLNPEAESVHHLSLERLKKEGVPPRIAMLKFEDWLINQAAPHQQALFVAFNAAFDWMFVNYYFYHYLGRNPFGYTAIDIKAIYMGLTGLPWSLTSWRHIVPNFQSDRALSHHALQDALDQAEVFKKLLTEIRTRNHSNRR